MLTRYQIKRLTTLNERVLAQNKRLIYVFPFVFTTGTTTRANQAGGQFGQLRRLFDGKNSVLVRWLGSRKPLRLNADRKAYLEFQDGVSFNAFSYNYNLFNFFQKDEVTETVELLNYKTIKLILNKAQISHGIGSSFVSHFVTDEIIPLAEVVDDTWLSILYYIPSASDGDLFFIESATLFKDNTGELVTAELNLRSLTTELRQSGRLLEQWVNFASPGDQFARPVLDPKVAKGFRTEVVNNPGVRYIQIETDDVFAYNSITLFGRPVNPNLSILETPRLLFLTNPIQPILNTARKTFYFIREYSLVIGDFLNDFFYPDAKAAYLAKLESQYNPIQKRETTAYFLMQKIVNPQLAATGYQKMTVRNAGVFWHLAVGMEGHQHPVRLFASKMSREVFKFKALATGGSEPDVTTTLPVRNPLEVLNLNAISFQNNSEFNIGNKVYSQTVLGLFSSLISTAATGSGAAIGFFTASKLSNKPTRALAGGAIGGFLGQALGRFVDINTKAGSSSFKVENPDAFKGSLFVPKIIVDKMKVFFESGNRIPLALFMGDKNFITSLGMGKLPTVLTFQISDQFANGKTSLDAISKTGNFDIKDEWRVQGTGQEYAIDSWRILGLGMCDLRVSFYDKNKNLVYTSYQQTTAKFSENVLDATTESATSDYEAMSGALPIGFDNILDAKTVPASLVPLINAQLLRDVDNVFYQRDGFIRLASGNIATARSSTAGETSAISAFTKEIQLISHYDYANLWSQFPNFKIKFNYTVKVVGSYYKINVASGQVALPVINAMQSLNTVLLDKRLYNQIKTGQVVTKTIDYTFSTLGALTDQILLRYYYPPNRSGFVATSDEYCNGELALQGKLQFSLQGKTIRIKITAFKVRNLFPFGNHYYAGNLNRSFSHFEISEFDANPNFHLILEPYDLTTEND